MKRFLFLLSAVLCTLCIHAQNEVMNVNLGDTVVSFRIADIHEITFGVEEEQVDTTLFHAFNGYIIVSSAYFTDSYYGDQAKLGVYKTSKGEYIVTFSDPVWGEAFFGHVSVGRTLEATGTIKMANPRGGNATEYEASLSGPMTTPVITIPSVMGGTSITFHVGEAPMALQVSGRHKGNVSVLVGGQFGPYVSTNVTYSIQANADGTINITIPEYALEGTVMGDLTLGSYTVKNVAWNEERAAFYRDYAADELSMHLTAVKDGATTMDSDYTFTALGNIEVKKDGQNLTIVNNFQPGRMPFPVEATFNTEL